MGGGMEKKKDESKEDVNKKNFGQFFKKVNEHSDHMKVPSMLVLLSNSVEIIRLRNILIYTLEQVNVLEKIYYGQMKTLSKEGRANFKDPFNFQNYIAN